jgi:cyclase
MDKDGTQSGYDNLLNRMVSESVGIPVIASGGCGSLQHLADAFIEGKASAALAATIFHFGQHTITEAKRFLRDRGIPMRLTE